MKYFLAKSAKIWRSHILADFAKIAFFEGFEGTSKPSKNSDFKSYAFSYCFLTFFIRSLLSDLIKNVKKPPKSQNPQKQRF